MLSMTEDEIKISYRDALNKPIQITILSQLNCCPKQVICDILGLTSKNIESSPTRIRDMEIVRREEKFMKYYKLNYCDKDIARHTHSSRSVVEKWRIDNYLKPLHDPKSHKKK